MSKLNTLKTRNSWILGRYQIKVNQQRHQHILKPKGGELKVFYIGQTLTIDDHEEFIIHAQSAILGFAKKSCLFYATLFQKSVFCTKIH